MEFLLSSKCQFCKKSGPPDRIPVFSTITTALSRIERPRRHHSTTRDPNATDLNVLSALAKILARDHEVAAVVAKRDSSTLVVVACVQRTVEPHIELGVFQQLIPKWLITIIRHWFKMRLDDRPIYDKPTIVIPTQPNDMGASLEQYIIRGPS